MQELEKCFITDCEIVGNPIYTSYKNEGKFRLINYIIKIDEEKFHISTSGLDESLIIEENRDYLNFYKGKLKDLIKNKDERIQGVVFCWDCKKAPENFIRLIDFFQTL